jgi:hypothetical protein
MSDSPSTDPIQAFYRSTSQARYDATVKQIRQTATLWTLSDEQGCVIVDSGKERCLPIWPTQETAAAWATAEHASCQPMAVELSAFMDKWVTGMSQDGFDLAIAPSMAAECLVETPEQFALNFSDTTQG